MTRQIADILLVEEQKYYLNEELLEAYFRQFPARRPAFPVCFTALWRGYVATFELKQDALLLKELDTMSAHKSRPQLSAQDAALVEALVGQKCTWYSGLLRIDDFRGEFDEEPENGLFEYLEIRGGDFLQKRVLDFQQLQAFKDEQYGYFLLSDEGAELYAFFERLIAQGVFATETADELTRQYLLRHLKQVY